MTKHHRHGPSKLDRIAHCPGSANFIDAEDAPDNDYAARGHMLHAVVATGDQPAEISSEDHQIVLDALAYRALHFGDCDPIKVEQHLTLMDTDFQILTEGTADVVGLTPDVVKILDWKFGYKYASVHSLQFKAYAAAAMQTYGRDVCEVHVWQPGGKEPGRQIMYNDFQALRVEITGVIRESQRADAVYRAGDWCTYCPGLAVCTVALAGTSWKAEDADATSTALTEYRKAAMSDPRMVGKLFQEWKRIEKIGKEIDKRCREMTEQGADTGFEIKTSCNKVVTDSQGAYDALVGIIGHSEWMSLVTIPIGTLTDIYASKMKQTVGWSKKESTERLLTLLGDAVTNGNERKTMRLKKGD